MKKIMLVITVVSVALCGCRDKIKEAEKLKEESGELIGKPGSNNREEKLKKDIEKMRKEIEQVIGKPTNYVFELSVKTNTHYSIELDKDVITGIYYVFEDKKDSSFHKAQVRFYGSNMDEVGFWLLDIDLNMARDDVNDSDIIAPKVIIYDDVGTVISFGRVVMDKTGTCFVGYRDGSRVKHLRDEVSKESIINALAKSGYTVRIDIFRFDNTLLYSIVLKGNSNFSNFPALKREQLLLEQEKQRQTEMEAEENRLRAEKEAREKREKEERIRLAWEEKEKKMKPIRAVQKEIERTKKMIDSATKNGYNRAAKKYREDLKKLEEKLEKLEKQG